MSTKAKEGYSDQPESASVLHAEELQPMVFLPKGKLFALAHQYAFLPIDVEWRWIFGRFNFQLQRHGCSLLSIQMTF